MRSVAGTVALDLHVPAAALQESVPSISGGTLQFYEFKMTHPEPKPLLPSLSPPPAPSRIEHLVHQRSYPRLLVSVTQQPRTLLPRAITIRTKPLQLEFRPPPAHFPIMQAQAAVHVAPVIKLKPFRHRTLQCAAAAVERTSVERLHALTRRIPAAGDTVRLAAERRVHGWQLCRKIVPATLALPLHVMRGCKISQDELPNGRWRQRADALAMAPRVVDAQEAG
jgi:hypothetical protein